MHDIVADEHNPLQEYTMPSSDAFALRRSGLDEFLFAPVGVEANGMTLSVVSVFARMGDDPWLEAGRLARLPKSEATESLARSIVGMPTSIWSLQVARAIAVGLIALLPMKSEKSSQGSAASKLGARTRSSFRLAVVLVCVASVLAFEAGIFTGIHVPTLDRNGVAGNVVLPP